MKKHLTIVCGMVIAAAIVSSALYFGAAPYHDGLIRIGDHTVRVQYRSTPAERAHGLSGREGLCGGCGMLFVFEDAAPRGFWMKDMRFDIDILWLREGTVVHIEHSVTHKTPEKTYKPHVAADMVLELPAGTAYKKGITTKDVALQAVWRARAITQ